MTTSTDHTPAPWVAVHNGYFWDIKREGGVFDIASVNSAWKNDELMPGNQDANAHLIAASPELLAALEATTRELIGERDCLYESTSRPDGTIPDEEDRAGIAELDRVIDQAQKAIAKARGGD